MTTQATPGARFGVTPFPMMGGQLVPPALVSPTALTATNSGIAVAGRLIHNSGPGASVTCDKIHFLPGTNTFTGSSVLKAGLQGVATGTSALYRPNGTYLSAGNAFANISSGSFTNDTWFSTGVINSGSGTALTVGQALSVVVECTAFQAGDSLIPLKGLTPNGAGSFDRLHHGFLERSTNVSGNAWVIVTAIGNVILEMHDGTFGTISGAWPTDNTLTNPGAFTNATGSTEYGLIFQLPYPFTVYGVWAWVNLASSATGTFKFYGADGNSPLSSNPTANANTIDIDPARSRSTASANHYEEWFTGTISGLANTPYCISLLATSANNLTLYATTVNATGHLDAFAGQNCYMASRTGTNAFAATNSTKDFPLMGVLIGGYSDGVGSGGGMLVHPGMSGGARG